MRFYALDMCAAAVHRAWLDLRERRPCAALSVGTLAWCATSFTGCYEPNLGDCVLACGPSDRCPSGQHCDRGLCTASRACNDVTMGGGGGAAGSRGGVGGSAADAGAGTSGAGGALDAGGGGAGGIHDAGEPCTKGTECSTGNCVDDHCCATPKCGECQTCANSRGTCVQVRGSDDPDSCSGTRTCDADAVCANRTGPIVEFNLPTARSRPEGIALGPDSALWFTEAQGNRIGRISSSGNITEFEIPTADSYPGGITAGPDDAVWFTERVPSSNGKIGRITRSGDITEFDVTTLGQPLEITVGSDGNLWFTKQSLTETHAIDRMTPSGEISEFTLPIAGSLPGDITPGPDSSLWFAESGDTVDRITLSGDIVRYPLGTPGYAFGIALGADGNLWSTAHDIARVTPSGQVRDFPLLDSDPASPSAHYIAAGPDGNLWFTVTGANLVARITPRGIIREFEVPTANSDPWDVTAGPDGNLWFTESIGNKIGRLSPPPLAVELSGDGDGTVTSEGGEIGCGMICTHRTAPGAQVTLTATPAADALFTGWFGAGCSGTGTCTVDGGVTVTATFQRRHNYMFVTSTKVAAGDLYGLIGADAICQDRATAAQLPGTYVAWLSTSTIAAKDRLAGARGWIRPDGLPFADSVEDLATGEIFYPPRVDEFGDEIPVSNGEYVITGTASDGTKSGANCTDWTAAASGDLHEVGSPWSGTRLWTEYLVNWCTVPERLYCFGIDDATPLEPARVPGRVAFLALGQHWGGDGVTAFDQDCQTTAETNGLSGNFRAFVATTSASAASRFSTAGELWVRPDGIPVAATASRLFDGSPLLAPIEVSAERSHLDTYVFSGAQSPTDLSTFADDCTDWTVATDGLATCGDSAMTTNTFFMGWGSPCSTPAHIRCLQQ